MSEELDVLTLVASRLDAAGIPYMVSGSTIWVASPEDLVLAKLVWAKPSHSEVQLRDVRNLIACTEDLDWPYVERCARDLTVSELLDQVRA